MLALLIAVPSAALSARRQGGIADHAVRVLSTAGLGFPSFWLGAMLILLFSVKLDWLPVSGYGTGLGDKLVHLVLPGLTIALSLSAVLTRSLRAGMIAGLGSDIATAARARGMPETVVF